MPDVCTSVDYGSFNNMRSLEYVYLSENISTIGSEALSGCTNLKRLNLNNIAAISAAFKNLHSLQYIKIPEGISSLPNICFTECQSAYEIDLPSTITSIGTQAFNNSYNVRRIIVRSTVPPTLSNVNAFHGAYVSNSGADYRSAGAGTCCFYVPYSEDHSILQAYLDSDATSS